MMLLITFLSFTNIKQNVVLEVANQLEEISMEQIDQSDVEFF